jgi:hypothetical protein
MDESGDISKSGMREALNTASSANLISTHQHGEIGSIFVFFKIQGIPVLGFFSTMFIQLLYINLYCSKFPLSITEMYLIK